MWRCASGITRHSLTDLKTDCNTKITGVNSKLTSHKTRQVHTETKLKEHITFNKINRRAGKRIWTNINKEANKGINKRIKYPEWCKIIC